MGRKRPVARRWRRCGSAARARWHHPDDYCFSAIPDRLGAAETGGLNYLYIDKTALLCPEGTLESCQVQIGETPAFYDIHHLTFPFARYLGQRIAQRYSEELLSLGFPANAPASAAD